MAEDRQHSNTLRQRLAPLSESQRWAVGVIAAWMQRCGKISGVLLQDAIHDWLTSGAQSMVEWLDGWVGRTGCSRPPTRHLEAAQRTVDRWMASGIWCARREAPSQGFPNSARCPRVVFGTGSEILDRPLAAFFNSRKPRLRSPGERWLDDLRELLPKVEASGIGLASSVGTLTYDLVTVYAMEHRLPLVLWLPAPLERLLGRQAQAPFHRPLESWLQLTCWVGAAACSAPTRSVCRDRMLAELSDVHCLLEIRSRGNLEAILKADGEDAFKQRWVLDARSSQNADGPSWCPPLEMRGQPQEMVGLAVGPARQGTSQRTFSPRAIATPEPMAMDAIDWDRFLCHYTRACVGPWPGQTYEDYLLDLLDEAPHCRHSALDSLIRILLESRIRASAKLLKGDMPAVSFTSLAPSDLQRLRHWNRVLARWTVEPYGIAVDRGFLKRAGARPVIYGRSTVYERLSERDRFRFQKHEPPGALWKQEREWRLPRDLLLGDLPEHRRLALVPTEEEAARLAEAVGTRWKVVVLGGRSTRR